MVNSHLANYIIKYWNSDWVEYLALLTRKWGRLEVCIKNIELKMHDEEEIDGQKMWMREKKSRNLIYRHEESLALWSS